MATTTFEKPMGSEVETLKTNIATLNSKILNRQNRTYVSTVSAFNEYCTNLGVGVGADVAATGDVMNAIVGINGFGIMSIVKVSNSGVHISYAIAFNQHVGSCVYNFTNSTTTNLNDLNSKINTRQVTGGISGVTIYKSGNVVDIQIRTGNLTSTTAQWYKLGTLPSECIPPATLEFTGYDNNSNTKSSMPIQCKIDTSGNIYVWIFANDSIAARAHICYAVV